MEKNSRCNNHTPRDRANGGTFPKFGEGGQRRRMDGQLTVVCNGLDDEDPNVSAPEAPADRAGQADMIAWIDVILRQQLGPARVKPHALAPDHGRIEIRFEQARAGSPDVEITVAARFEQKEDAD